MEGDGDMQRVLVVARRELSEVVRSEERENKAVARGEAEKKQAKAPCMREMAMSLSTDTIIRAWKPRPSS